VLSYIKMKTKDLFAKYQLHKEDSGSTAVQIILLTQEITRLVKHLKVHKKDFDSKMGLLKMLSKRRKYLNYLQKKDLENYQSLILDLGLRK